MVGVGACSNVKEGTFSIELDERNAGGIVVGGTAAISESSDPQSDLEVRQNKG
jgi:hypothetical protein